MPPRRVHDTLPPPNWPEEIQYLPKPILSPTFPSQLIPLLTSPSTSKFAPHPSAHPSNVIIKRITTPGHPACGQNGLFARSKISGGTLIVPYLGVIHASYILEDLSLTVDLPGLGNVDQHAESDYDLSLLRISASDPKNPFPGAHISIGVDADKSGNAGRMVNDYRGVAGQPNAEFKVGKGPGGDMRMELWSLKDGVKKGDEVLVSYGKGWWAGRRSEGN